MRKYKIVNLLCIIVVFFFLITISTTHFFIQAIQNENEYYNDNFKYDNSYNYDLLRIKNREDMFSFSSICEETIIINEPFSFDFTDNIHQESSNMLIVDANDDQFYKSIQQAINDAIDGTYIYVRKGEYPEILTINKQITIVGEDKNSTIINPTSTYNSYAITITQSNVILSGFSVQNKADGLYTTAIKILAPYATITDCIVVDTAVGISVWSSHNTISHCYFTGCDDEGIVLLGNSNSDVCCNIITDSIFYNNKAGIEIKSSSKTSIHRCTFIKNTHAGIDSIGEKNNNTHIINCIFTHNGGYALLLIQSLNTTIRDSLFDRNAIFSYQSKNTTITQSHVDSLRLYNQSVLLMINCNAIAKENIHSFNSSYELFHVKDMV